MVVCEPVKRRSRYGGNREVKEIVVCRESAAAAAAMHIINIFIFIIIILCMTF